METPTPSSRRASILKAVAFLLAALLLLELLPLSTNTISLKSWSCKNASPTQSTAAEKAIPTSPESQILVVPNIVHFIHLLEDPSKPFDLKFTLGQFVVIYSAFYHLRQTQSTSTRIYGSFYQGSVRPSYRETTWRRVQASQLAQRDHIWARDRQASESIRLRPDRGIKKVWGIYLDADSFVLHDLAHLRRTGFELVLGQQSDGKVGWAVILSTPQNALISAYQAIQDRIFDGEWITHAVELLTGLVDDFAEPEHQFLILTQKYFFPGSWRKEDLERLYQQRNENGATESHFTPNASDNLTYYVEHFRMGWRQTWQMDWRSSYTLHGWNTGLLSFINNEARFNIFLQADGITMEYLLSQISNFARAVDSAVKHAVDTGIVGNEYLTLAEGKESVKGQPQEQDTLRG